MRSENVDECMRGRPRINNELRNGALPPRSSERLRNAKKCVARWALALGTHFLMLPDNECMYTYKVNP